MGRRFPRFIRVAAIHYKPFFEIPSNPNEKPGGIEGRLLETLSEALGFRYELVIAEDNEWGRLKKDGNWTGMIGLVTTGKADIATCSPAITSDRMRAVDFTIPYITTDSAFSTSLPRHLPPAYTYWYPFDGYTWMCIFTLLMIMPLVFFVISNRRRSYFSALLAVFGSLLGRSTTNRNLKWRYVATGWNICATFLSLSYGAVVSSFLFKPLLGTQVKNMQELSKAVRAGDMKVYVWKGTFQVELMMESEMEHLMFIAEAIKKNRWFVDTKKGLSPDFYKGKVAFLEGRIALNLRYGLPPLRTKFISKDGCANARAGIALSKNFCCKEKLDRVLDRIMASGLHNKYLTDEIFRSWLTVTKQGSVPHPDIRALTLQDLSGAMFVLVAGYSAALVILLGEILFKSEIMAIGAALDHALTTDKDGIWILTDSKSAIQYLRNWPQIFNIPNQTIMKLLYEISLKKPVSIQWIPSHVGVYGNEIADTLAKNGCGLPSINSNKLTPSEIHSLNRQQLLSVWRNPPVHHWYAAHGPGLSISCSGPRPLQSTMARFRSGHLKCMRFMNGEKIFSPCSCSLPASPAHLLDCLGASWRQLRDEQERIYGELNRRGLLDLV